MTSRHPTRSFALTALAAACAASFLVACGGDDPDNPPMPDPPATVTLKGSAAIGSAFTGATVTVVDSSGASKAAKAAVGADGLFEADVTSLKAPLAVVATGTVGDETRTLVALVAALPASGDVAANVNPMTHALAGTLSSTADPALFTGASAAAAIAAVTQAQIDAKLAVLRAALANPMQAAGIDATTFNPMTSTVTPGTATGADYLIEVVKVAVTAQGIELRDALTSAVLTVTPSTAVADVSGDKALPPAPANGPVLADAKAAASALEAALAKCFAGGPATREDTPGGNLLAPCTDLDDAVALDYLNSSYSADEIYGPWLADASLTGAKWRVEIDRLTKDESGTEIATVYIRYARADGSGGFRVDTARKPSGGEWLVTGNRRPFDASTQPYLNRTLYNSDVRPLGANGQAVNLENGNGFYESGVRFFFNPLRHPDVRAVRITNAVPGVGGLPAAGVVLGRAVTDTAVTYNGCARGDRLVLVNNTGNVNVAPVTFRSNNLFALDRRAADPAKPIALERWTQGATFADAPLTAAVPAYTFYRFEIFRDGNNTSAPDSTFTTAVIAPVPLASAGAAFRWAEFTDATRALAQRGAAVDSPTVAFTVPAGGLAPTSAAGFGRPSNNSTERTLSSAQLPLGGTSVAVANTAPAGCAAGPLLPELGETGGGFRGVSVFRQGPDTTRYDNGLQWNNWQ